MQRAGSAPDRLLFRIYFPRPPYDPGIAFPAPPTPGGGRNWVGCLIGPGGANIKAIQATTGISVISVLDSQGGVKGRRPDPLDPTICVLLIGDAPEQLRGAARMVADLVSPSNAALLPFDVRPGGATVLTLSKPGAVAPPAPPVPPIPEFLLTLRGAPVPPAGAATAPAAMALPQPPPPPPRLPLPAAVALPQPPPPPPRLSIPATVGLPTPRAATAPPRPPSPPSWHGSEQQQQQQQQQPQTPLPLPPPRERMASSSGGGSIDGGSGGIVVAPTGTGVSPTPEVAGGRPRTDFAPRVTGGKVLPWRGASPLVAAIVEEVEEMLEEQREAEEEAAWRAAQEGGTLPADHSHLAATFHATAGAPAAAAFASAPAGARADYTPPGGSGVMGGGGACGDAQRQPDGARAARLAQLFANLEGFNF